MAGAVNKDEAGYAEYLKALAVEVDAQFERAAARLWDAVEVDAQFERAAARLWDLSGIPDHNSVTVQCFGPTVLTGTQPCASCGPGRCDGSTQDCTLDSYYANPANGPRPSAAGTAQNPVWPNPGWFGYPATRYDEHAAPVTERLPTPPALRCECGSGDHTRSGAHSHWCPCWLAP